MKIPHISVIRISFLAPALLVLFFILAFTQVDFVEQMAHGFITKAHCLLYDPWLMGVYGVADLVVWISCWAVSYYYLRLWQKLANDPSIRNIAVRQVCWWFALFIFLYGLNHLFDVLLLHYRIYVQFAFLKIAVATVGFYVAFFIAPQIVRLVAAVPQWFAAGGTSDDLSAALVRGVQLEMLISLISDGVILVDDQGTITSASPAVERIFGYPMDEIVGRPVKFLIPPRYHAAHDRGMAAMRSGEVPRVRAIPLAVTGLHSGGQELQLEIAITSWRRENGDWQSGAVIRDITQQQRFRSELFERQRFRSELFEQNRLLNLSIVALAEKLDQIIASKFNDRRTDS